MKELEIKLIKLEKHLFKPEVRASYEELDRLISDNFIEIGASGVRFGKKVTLERLPREFPPEIKAYDFELRLLSNDCVQLLYKASMIKNVEGIPTYSLRCSIWSQNNGLWQIVYHQGTNCYPFKL